MGISHDRNHQKEQSTWCGAASEGSETTACCDLSELEVGCCCVSVQRAQVMYRGMTCPGSQCLSLGSLFSKKEVKAKMFFN